MDMCDHTQDNRAFSIHFRNVNALAHFLQSTFTSKQMIYLVYAHVTQESASSQSTNKSPPATQ